MQNPTFEIVTTSAGAVSIRDNVTGEIMHNPVGPWVEANSLYVDQSRLVDRLREPTDRPLVIFDVGLGAGANAIATMHCARTTGGRRPLTLISFERDLTLLRFALDHADEFAHFAGFGDAVRAMLDHGSWTEPGIRWELRLGDYVEQIARETERAHLIFFEPYSPKKNADMWTVDVFKDTYRTCSPDGALLFTYSQATPIRVALLVAGFCVGVGSATGLKSETTTAATAVADLERPLDEAWLGRWGRSHSPNPAGWGVERTDEVRRSIASHRQFTTAP